MDTRASNIILITAFLVCVAASFWLGGRFALRNGYPVGKPDTVEVVKWVRDTIIEPKDSIIYERIPVLLPVHDTTEISDTVTIRDSVLVEVPITEKTYTGENYKAVVRGFQPELVDIWIKQTTKTITVPYRKRWSFTAGPQVGVGITPGGWQPYAGAGVTFGYSF